MKISHHRWKLCMKCYLLIKPPLKNCFVQELLQLELFLINKFLVTLDICHGSASFLIDFVRKKYHHHGWTNANTLLIMLSTSDWNLLSFFLQVIHHLMHGVELLSGHWTQPTNQHSSQRLSTRRKEEIISRSITHQIDSSQTLLLPRDDTRLQMTHVFFSRKNPLKLWTESLRSVFWHSGQCPCEHFYSAGFLYNALYSRSATVWSEASEGTLMPNKALWRGKSLFTNNRLPLQYFVS